MPTTDLDKLSDVVRDMLPCLEIGMAAHLREQAMSAHEKMLHLEHLEDARIIAKYQWSKGPISAYTRMSTLTPILQLGLFDASAREALRNKNYTTPMAAWKSVFTDFGMTATHANTGSPAWSRITSC